VKVTSCIVVCRFGCCQALAASRTVGERVTAERQTARAGMSVNDHSAALVWAAVRKHSQNGCETIAVTSGAKSGATRCPRSMRAYLKADLQERWEDALRERKQLSSRSVVSSVVPVLDALLAAERTIPAKIGSRPAPRIGHGPAGAKRRGSASGH
jgi:hypothetical protein